MKRARCLTGSSAAGFFAAISIATLLPAADPYAADRERMVREQIEARGNDLRRAQRSRADDLLAAMQPFEVDVGQIQ